jgi:hypothetical protein
MFNRCCYPGCNARAITKKETCRIHGRYVVCGSHCERQIWDRVLDAPNVLGCPLCVAAAKAALENERRLAETEASRRNAGDQPQVTFSHAVAEFRAQGYGQEAAEALAKKWSILMGGPAASSNRRLR